MSDSAPTSPSPSENPPRTLTANVNLRLGDRPVSLRVDVPAGKTKAIQILPLVHSLTQMVVEQSVESQQAKITCDKGCGACCRQLVPVSTVEARALYDLVQAMEEPRRSAVLARFDEAQARTKAAGLQEHLHDFMTIPIEERRSFAHSYFKLDLPCPFLEEESCSIHPDRPVICREYLVTSDPVHCAGPNPGPVQRIGISAHVSSALPALEASPDSLRTPWVALTDVMRWVPLNPETAQRTGPQIVQAFFEKLSGDPVADPPGMGQSQA